MKKLSLFVGACATALLLHAAPGWSAEPPKSKPEDVEKTLRDWRDVIQQLVPRPYDPKCGEDVACNVWAEFRSRHPFPYQTFAAKSSDAELIVIISEPAPALDKQSLEELARTAFGNDLIKAERKRWFIGIDGWVEDLVLTTKPVPAGAEAGAKPESLLADATFRDRMALLHLALYGTTYGGRIEAIGETEAPAHTAANLQVRPSEIRAWLKDPALVWRAVGTRNGPAMTFPKIRDQRSAGVYASAEGDLVLMLLPAGAFARARSDPEKFSEFRAQFRTFAVASDLVLAGLCLPKGNVAIVARARMLPPEVLPPLRFETFSLLLREAKNELQQSYERTTLFAGRMRTGEQRRRDWAPIYLSDSLIDTEFGALLNITDQLLKGWSEAGRIEYLYFDYPYAPQEDAFVFGKRPLSSIVMEKNGASWVLFNWNTSGLATINEYSDYALLAVHRTGSLPVTYGSEAKAGDGMKTGGALVELEDQAYDYFSGMKDPNLARVVQYTLLYQVFRAAAQRMPAGQAMEASAPASGKHQSSAAVLAAEAAALLADIDAERLMPTSGELSPAQAEKWRDYVRENVAKPLADFRKKHPELAQQNTRLAELLADSRAQQGAAVAGAQRLLSQLPRLQREAATIEGDEKRFQEKAQQVRQRALEWARHNQIAVNTLNESGLPVELRRQFAALRTERDALNRRNQYLSDAAAQLKDLQEKQALFADVQALEAKLRKTVWAVRDLGRIQEQYVAANAAEPRDSIKTPSTVVSWDTTLEAEGGHNLNSRALKIEADAAVRDVEIVAEEGGVKVRVNPTLSEAASAKAAQIARLVEHGNVREPKALLKVIQEPPPPARPRLAALEIPTSVKRENWAGPFAERAVVKDSEVASMRAHLSEALEACRCDAVVSRDDNGFRVMAERNLKPPPQILLSRFNDTVSFRDYLQGTKARSEKNGASGRILFLKEHPEHVHWLAEGLDSPNIGRDGLMKLAGGMGDRGELGASYLNVKAPQARASIRIIESAESSGPMHSPTEAAVLYRSSPWAKAKAGKVEFREGEALLHEGRWPKDVKQWNSDRDGIPYGVELVFPKSQGSGSKVSALIVAGLDRARLPAAKVFFTSAFEKVQKRQAAAKGSLMDGFTELKSYVDRQGATKGGIKRLVLILKEERFQVLVTERDRDGRGG